MKTQKQKLNTAKKKLTKVSTDLETIVEKLDMIADDFDDDTFSDMITSFGDAITDMIEGNARASLPELHEYLENYNIDYEE